MTKYAKFISEDCIRYAPRTLKEQSFICFNFDKASPEILNSRGYYQVIEDEQPECEEGYYLRPTYELCSETIEEENEDGYFVDVNREYIAVHWTVEEIQEEENESE